MLHRPIINIFSEIQFFPTKYKGSNTKPFFTLKLGAGINFHV